MAVEKGRSVQSKCARIAYQVREKRKTRRSMEPSFHHYLLAPHSSSALNKAGSTKLNHSTTSMPNQRDDVLHSRKV